MCIVFLYIPRDSSESFMLAFNRDESFLRPTSSLHIWENDPNIIGGQDLTFNGTWLGINKQTGNLACLTNLVDEVYINKPFQLGKLSRGEVINKFLHSDFAEKHSFEEIFEDLIKLKDEYNPFNLLVGNLKQMDFFYLNLIHGEWSALPKGEITGFSNNLMVKGNDWKKVIHGKKLFRELLSKVNFDFSNQEHEILNIMSDKEDFGEHIAEESSIFIPTMFNEIRLIFGTVSTSIITVRDGQGVFSEFRNKTEFDKVKNLLKNRKWKYKLIPYVKMMMLLKRLKTFNFARELHQVSFGLNEST